MGEEMTLDSCILISENVNNVVCRSLQNVILEAEMVLVDFWGPQCSPCKAVAPVIEELSKEYEGRVVFAKVNVEESPFVASKYGVRSLPTIMIFRGGSPVQNVVGYQSKVQLKKALDNALQK
jgi:thioredoxin 1